MLVGWLVGWIVSLVMLVGWLVSNIGCLLGWLPACLPARLPACLPACLLSCLLNTCANWNTHNKHWQIILCTYPIGHHKMNTFVICGLHDKFSECHQIVFFEYIPIIILPWWQTKCSFLMFCFRFQKRSTKSANRKVWRQSYTKSLHGSKLHSPISDHYLFKWHFGGGGGERGRDEVILYILLATGGYDLNNCLNWNAKQKITYFHRAK